MPPSDHPRELFLRYSQLISDELDFRVAFSGFDFSATPLQGVSPASVSNITRFYVRASEHYARIPTDERKEFTPIFKNLTARIQEYFAEHGLFRHSH